MTTTLRVIDSHTAGEPTRVVLQGGIPLEGDTMPARRDDFRRRFDHLRSGIINEPRGSDVLVGAALTPAVTPGAAAGVVFFNNVGYLGMCGHGTLGVVETLRYLGLATPGIVSLDTPVGLVTANLHESGEVSLRNVRSYRYRAGVEVELADGSRFVGDIAYGGNWFYIVHEPEFEISVSRARELTDLTLRIKDALVAAGITGEGGSEIDHVELAGRPVTPAGDSRNFVLCPGGAYDRSPCGTGTSAKLACLYAAGRLKAGLDYVQESVLGTAFTGRVEPAEGGVIPTIVGRAYVTADSTLIFQEDDSLAWGLR